MIHVNIPLVSLSLNIRLVWTDPNVWWLRMWITSVTLGLISWKHKYRFVIKITRLVSLSFHVNKPLLFSCYSLEQAFVPLLILHVKKPVWYQFHLVWTLLSLVWKNPQTIAILRCEQALKTTPIILCEQALKLQLCFCLNKPPKYSYSQVWTSPPPKYSYSQVLTSPQIIATLWCEHLVWTSPQTTAILWCEQALKLHLSFGVNKASNYSYHLVWTSLQTTSIIECEQALNLHLSFGVNKPSSYIYHWVWTSPQTTAIIWCEQGLKQLSFGVNKASNYSYHLVWTSPQTTASLWCEQALKLQLSYGVNKHSNYS